jgi:ketosteroid isomerase-like protein
MNHFAGSPDVVALSFIDCINRGDVEGLVALMTDDHELRIFDEPPVSGRQALRDGWTWYARSFPRYLIHPQQFAIKGDEAAVLGCTTGSHLGLPDDEERKLTLIWVAVADGPRLRSWTLIYDTPENRRSYGLE